MTTEPQTRRELLTMIGAAGGSMALYNAMTTFAHAAESQFKGPLNLKGAKPGASVLILGSGLAGMMSAYELRKAGYKVQILEFQNRPGGRNYTVRGGDKVVELGSDTQTCQFQPGNYLNPGPWRIPHHHRFLMHYAKMFGVELEPFIQLNHNVFVHSAKAFGGKPQRYKELEIDFKGHTAELLAKSLNAGHLDDKLTKEDKEKMLEAMRDWGVLDSNLDYTASLKVSGQRGYDRAPGGGVNGAPTPSKINGITDVLNSHVWTQVGFYFNYVMQTTMFQPKGGIDMIGKAFAKELGPVIQLNTKVTKIEQNGSGVTAYWQDTSGKTGVSKADWCVCTIPLPVLSQMDIQVGPALKAATQAVPYGAAVKTGLEFKRRFWEDDYSIYGGHSFTDQDISLISYPNFDFHANKPGVLLGTFANGAAGGFKLSGLTPAQRIEVALEQGSVFHPEQYRKEFMNGTTVAWSRMPWIRGCSSSWTEESRAKHYQNLVAIDGRIVLAGEHASYYGGWMEGAFVSATDAITRLHQKAMAA